MYLLRPQLQVEGSYPIIVPLYDKERNLITEIFHGRLLVIFIVNEMSKEYVFLKSSELRADCRVEQNNVSELPEEVESVLIGFNEKLHVAQWDLASSMT